MKLTNTPGCVLPALPTPHHSIQAPQQYMPQIAIYEGTGIALPAAVVHTMNIGNIRSKYSVTNFSTNIIIYSHKQLQNVT